MRSRLVALVALAVLVAACSGGGRETPTLSIPDQPQGQVTTPDALAVTGCRLGFGTGIGAEVVTVAEDIPASTVLQPGDVITEIDGEGVTESADLIAVIRTRQAGDSVNVRVERTGSEPFDAAVELVEHTDGSGDAMLGVGVRTAVDLRQLGAVGTLGALESPLTAVVSVDGNLYAVDVLEGTWLSLDSATPVVAWTPAAGAVYTLREGDPDRLVNVTDGGTSVDLVVEGWDGRRVLGSQAGLVLVYAEREGDAGTQGGIFAVDPVSGSAEWFWSPVAEEPTDDNPLPIFAVSAPSQERTLVATAQTADDGATSLVRFSLLDRNGEPVLVVPPGDGELPAGLVTIGWYDDSRIAYHQAETGGIVVWNVDTGDLAEVPLPFTAEDARFVPVGDGDHFMMVTEGSLALVGSGATPSMRPLAVACTADQIAPPGFVG